MYNKRAMGSLRGEIERGKHDESVHIALEELGKVEKNEDLKSLYRIQPIVEEALISFNKPRERGKGVKGAEEEVYIEGAETRDESGNRKDLILNYFLNLELSLYKNKSEDYTKWVIFLEKIKDHKDTPISRLVEEIEIYVSQQNESSNRKVQVLSQEEFQRIELKYNTDVKEYIEKNMSLIDQLRAISRLDQRIGHLKKKVVATDNKVSFGEWLKVERANRGWSFKDVADRTGYSTSYIHRIEQGVRNNPTPQAIAKIVAAMGYEPDNYLSLLTNDDKDSDVVDLHALITMSNFSINNESISAKKKDQLSYIIKLICEDDVLQVPKINELKEKIKQFQE